jgi:hypothetical protein
LRRIEEEIVRRQYISESSGEKLRFTDLLDRYACKITSKTHNLKMQINGFQFCIFVRVATLHG